MTSAKKRSPASRSSAKDRAGSAFNAFPYRPQPDRREVDFPAVSRAAVAALPAVLARIVPGGKILGREYTALNPTRADRRPGSFKVNLRTGRWADFATGDKGGDPIDWTVKPERRKLPVHRRETRGIRHLAGFVQCLR